MIYDEAVEAAAKVMFDQSTVPDGIVWDDLREEYCALMRPSLEAAAPHMQAKASAEEIARLIEQIDEGEMWDPDPGIYLKYANAIIAAGYRKTEQ